MPKPDRNIPFPSHLLRRMAYVVRQPVFLSLAVLGNSIILLAATALYFLEIGINPRIGSFLDSLWWAVATVTTVGFGDVTPITTAGKWLGIVMMLTGTTLFCSFTALFSSILLSTEFREVEENVKKIAKKVVSLEQEVQDDEGVMARHLVQMENSLNELKSLTRRRTD